MRFSPCRRYPRLPPPLNYTPSARLAAQDARYNAPPRMALPAKDYADALAAFVPEKRHAHSLNVAAAARQLAERFAPEFADQAELAGLLHDNAKGMTVAELIEGAERLDIEVTDIERDQPKLLHGKVGAALLGERFGVEDMGIAQAVADHVTGRHGMGMLSEILFVADQAAADRDFPGVEQLRETAQRDLDAAVLQVLKFKLAYLMQKNRPIVLEWLAVYNEYVGRRQVAETERGRP